MAFWKEEDGLSAVEYAVVGAVLIAGLVTAFSSLSGRVSNKVNEIAT
jgi:Flp pilus assembly pilin Flp